MGHISQGFNQVRVRSPTANLAGNHSLTQSIGILGKDVENLFTHGVTSLGQFHLKVDFILKDMAQANLLVRLQTTSQFIQFFKGNFLTIYKVASFHGVIPPLGL
jgi:hypothetical protein